MLMHLHPYACSEPPNNPIGGPCRPDAWPKDPSQCDSLSGGTQVGRTPTGVCYGSHRVIGWLRDTGATGAVQVVVGTGAPGEAGIPDTWPRPEPERDAVGRCDIRYAITSPSGS